MDTAAIRSCVSYQLATLSPGSVWCNSAQSCSSGRECTNCEPSDTRNHRAGLRGGRCQWPNPAALAANAQHVIGPTGFPSVGCGVRLAGQSHRWRRTERLLSAESPCHSADPSRRAAVRSSADAHLRNCARRCGWAARRRGLGASAAGAECR